MKRGFWVAWLLFACQALHAQGVVIEVPTRAGVTTTVFWEAVPQATATVFLLPGGDGADGGFGLVANGQPGSRNFLVRSASLFAAKGFNVAIFGRPADMAVLGWEERSGVNHREDLRRTVEAVKALAAVPVWVIGTSRGTVSAAEVAIDLQAQIAGLVLTSSVVDARTPGNVPGQDLAAIQVPTLVVHHALDACRLCQPARVPTILEGLTHAPVRKLMMVNGGSNPHGGVCQAMHWHGFVGMESQAVDLITQWIRNPVD